MENLWGKHRFFRMDAQKPQNMKRNIKIICSKREHDINCVSIFSVDADHLGLILVWFLFYLYGKSVSSGSLTCLSWGTHHIYSSRVYTRHESFLCSNLLLFYFPTKKTAHTNRPDSTRLCCGHSGVITQTHTVVLWGSAQLLCNTLLLHEGKKFIWCMKDWKSICSAVTVFSLSLSPLSPSGWVQGEP